MMDAHQVNSLRNELQDGAKVGRAVKAGLERLKPHTADSGNLSQSALDILRDAVGQETVGEALSAAAIEHLERKAVREAQEHESRAQRLRAAAAGDGR